MNKIYVLIVVLYICCASCQKQAVLKIKQQPNFLQQLQDSMLATDFSGLDINALEIAVHPKVERNWVRIPFKDNRKGEHFVLLQTNRDNIQTGKIIKIVLDSTGVNGIFEQRSLRGKLLLSSNITGGLINNLHPERLSTEGIRTESLPSENYLPEVVVVGYRRTGSTHPVIIPYMSLQPMLDEGDYGGGYGGGGSTGGGGSSPGDGTGVGGNYYVPAYPSNDYGFNQVLDIEMDYTDFIPVIDIRKYFNCFDLVPSAGATYSIKLCADLPINSDPGASLTLANGVSPGHSFLVISKTNGSQSVTQSFGYYPLTTPPFWDATIAVSSAIKNNSEQEINASYEITITASQFEAVKETAISIASRPYQIGLFNCVDYALEVFNKALPAPLSIPVYINQPGIFQAIGSPTTIVMKSAPQTLFDKLRTIKRDNAPGADKIVIDLSHHTTAPISHGECQ